MDALVCLSVVMGMLLVVHFFWLFFTSVSSSKHTWKEHAFPTERGDETLDVLLGGFQRTNTSRVKQREIIQSEKEGEERDCILEIGLYNVLQRK